MIDDTTTTATETTNGVDAGATATPAKKAKKAKAKAKAKKTAKPAKKAAKSKKVAKPAKKAKTTKAAKKSVGKTTKKTAKKSSKSSKKSTKTGAKSKSKTKTAKKPAAKKYRAPSNSGQTGPKIDLAKADLNPDETKVFSALAGSKPKTMGELAEKAFKNKGRDGKVDRAVAFSRVRNALRRLVRARLVKSAGRVAGVTASGVEMKRSAYKKAA